MNLHIFLLDKTFVGFDEVVPSFIWIIVVGRWIERDNVERDGFRLESEERLQDLGFKI